MATNYRFPKNVFDVNTPIKTKTVRRKPAPWLKRDLKRYMSNKDRLSR